MNQSRESRWVVTLRVRTRKRFDKNVLWCPKIYLRKQGRKHKKDQSLLNVKTNWEVQTLENIPEELRKGRKSREENLNSGIKTARGDFCVEWKRLQISMKYFIKTTYFGVPTKQPNLTNSNRKPRTVCDKTEFLERSIPKKENREWMESFLNMRQKDVNCRDALNGNSVLKYVFLQSTKINILKSTECYFSATRSMKSRLPMVDDNVARRSDSRNEDGCFGWGKLEIRNGFLVNRHCAFWKFLPHLPTQCNESISAARCLPLTTPA